MYKGKRKTQVFYKWKDRAMIIQAVDLAEVSGKLFFMHEKIQQAMTEIISNGIHI